MEETKEFTKEQRLFIEGKDCLKNIKDKAKAENRPLTEEEKEQIDEINLSLLKLVSRFMDLMIHEKLSRFRIANDAKEDVRQQCIMEFLASLDAYNPRRNTPLTYFRYQWMKCISNYIRDNSQHLTANDSSNLSKLLVHMRDYELRGIQYDIDMLAEKSGLSYRVVQNTLHYAYISEYGNIDDENYQSVASLQPSPQEAVEKEMTQSHLFTTMRKVLTDQELEFLFVKLGLGYSPEIGLETFAEELNYNELAERFNMQISEVKSLHSSIISKLYHSDLFQTKEGTKPLSAPSVELIDHSADIVLQDLIDFYSSDNQEAFLDQPKF